MSNPYIKKILVLAANPKNPSELRLEEEVREIDEGLLRARHREQFEMTSKWAVRVRDLFRHILDIQPQIVHFSGHGRGEDGIALEDETGKVALVQADALAGMFKLFASKGVECVLLNACYSEVQAELISQYIPYVVGMNKAISDKAAINFAVAFYDALGAGETYDFAFELGRSQLIGLKEKETPVFLCKYRLSIKGFSGKSNSNYTSVEQVVLEEPEGQVGLDSHFYVERPPIEADCYETTSSQLQNQSSNLLVTVFQGVLVLCVFGHDAQERENIRA